MILSLHHSATQISLIINQQTIVPSWHSMSLQCSDAIG